jgi:hypothetical protein
MFRAKDKPVPFSATPAYQKENGQWYVTVTIDNSSVIERLATADEIPQETLTYQGVPIKFDETMPETPKKAAAKKKGR